MKNIVLVIAIFSCLIMGSFDSYAQTFKRGRYRYRYLNQPAYQRINVVTTTTTRTAYPRSEIMVVEPSRVKSVTVLPSGHSTLAYKQKAYYSYRGVYYVYDRGVYNVVIPPAGLRVGALPSGYKKVIVGTVPHYYYEGVYYKALNSGYVIVDPTVGTEVPLLPELNVDAVILNGSKYFEYDDYLYKKVVKNNRVKYKVVGRRLEPIDNEISIIKKAVRI